MSAWSGLRRWLKEQERKTLLEKAAEAQEQADYYRHLAQTHQRGPKIRYMTREQHRSSPSHGDAT